MVESETTESALKILLAFLDDDVLTDVDETMREAFKQKRIKGENRKIIAETIDAEFKKRGERWKR